MASARASVGDRALRALGGIGGLASCLPMLAMLPAGIAGALAAVGASSTTGPVATLGQELGPAAKPLLLVSTALLAVGGLRCSRLAAGSALAGGTLLYLGMYVLTRPDGTTSPALFYPGLAFFLGTFLVGWIRPRVASCRPVLAGRDWRRLAVGTVLVGAAVTLGSLLVGFGSAPAHPTASGDGAMHGMSAVRTGAPSVTIRPRRFTWDAMLAGATRTHRYRITMAPKARIRVRGLFPDGMVTVRITDARGRAVFDEMYWSDHQPTGAAHLVRGRRGSWTVTLSLMQAGGGPFRIDVNG